MTIAYKSSGFPVATAVSLPVLIAPFPGVKTDYILRQDFMQNLADFTPLALNTPHPDAAYSAFILVEESEKFDVGGLVTRWTRTYAKVPASFTEPGGTYGYTFIGFVGQNQTSGTQVVYAFSGRERFTLPVPVQITRDFFLVDPVNPLPPTSYESWEDIPTVAAQRYYITLGNGQTLDVDYINAAVASLNVTTPTREQYEAMRTADAASQDSFSLVVETASPIRWLGNIFMRETRKIKAQ